MLMGVSSCGFMCLCVCGCFWHGVFCVLGSGVFGGWFLVAASRYVYGVRRISNGWCFGVGGGGVGGGGGGGLYVVILRLL